MTVKLWADWSRIESVVLVGEVAEVGGHMTFA